ncbi:TonB-dependent receptor [Alishewanella sp. 16-MA]|uniref:TonB-dependent receptor n=1 Tax=Alishewanella maricola TaxID=2795740 RepID=A0ABS8C8P0_9ALTE|nr:TonB-dependent receptor [Alishewanella maricola]MCB5228320.1 TonB-dependent receptor [Alishewanella maricola]
MKTVSDKATQRQFTRTLLSTFVALHLSNAFAQDSENSSASVNKDKALTTAEQIEIIEVKAQFSRNLTSALNVKRSAATIVDGISADDIGTLPALDLGEALQAVPGVQLNREGERRESSINLRSLPSGFVLNTANGQTFSNPTRSEKAFGAPTPFGAFDPAIFNGVDVIKTQTAAMQEGGIAGTVNMILPKALSKKDGALAVSVAGRNEELADTIDAEFVLSGSKHLIPNKLAISGTLATSEQTFRRDTIKINRYDNIPSNSNFVGANGENYAQWKATSGIPENAVTKMPGELRQGSELNSGRRTSFSGSLEFKPTDELKFGAQIVYTERDMDENGQQEIDIRPRNSGVKITPTSAPFDTGSIDVSGRPIYSVSDISFSNLSYGYTSRVFDLYEQTQAAILDSEWMGDVWDLDAAVTVSKSKNQLNEILYAPRFEPMTGSGNNGITGRLHTGLGNIKDFLVELNNFDNLNLNQNWRVLDTVSSAGITSLVNNNRVQALITGSYEVIERDANAVEFNAKRAIELGIFRNVQFGYRYSQETQDSDRSRSSPTGLELTGILTNEIRMDPAYASQSAFFGGEAPGIAGAGQGWYALDVRSLNAMLTQTIGNVNPDPVTGEIAVRVPYSNLVARGGQQSAGLVYDVTLDTSALYLMSDFGFDVKGMNVEGNIGARYVKSSQDATAPFYPFGAVDINNPPAKTVSNDYDYLLPSTNLAIDVTEDFKVRFAYNESISRPNIRAATPSTRIDAARPGEVNVTLPGADVDPFSAKSYDISLEWYNREGSAITLALFRKDVSDFFTSVASCDEAILESYGIDLGNITSSSGTCVTDGNDAYNNVDPNYILNGDNVNVSQVRNTNAKIKVQGYELSIQQNLNFLSYPWNGFGGIINYSNTSQDSPLEARIPGISEDTFNVIGYYEQGPLGIRLAYNYRSEYELESVGTFNGEGNKSVKAAGRLDLSAYYKVTDNLTISLKGYNLTNTLYEEYQDTEYQPRATHYDGRTFVLQAGYKF